MDDTDMKTLTFALLFLVFAGFTSGCPTWFLENGGHCECTELSDGTPAFVISCRQGERSVGAHVGVCVTFDHHRDSVLVGRCPYTYRRNMTNRLYSLLPNNLTLLNEAVCGPYNRKGVFCGNCINGFGPAVFSTNLQCANCSDISTGYAISLFLLIKLVPITIFCFIVVIFHFNITSGPLLSYVVFCQVTLYMLQWDTSLFNCLQSHLSWPFLVPFYFSLVIADMWNLHFFRYVLPSFCLSDRMTDIHVHTLNLFTAIYPLLLMVAAYIAIELHGRDFRVIQFAWKPFYICFSKLKKNWSVADSVIHAFATLSMLSSFALTYETYVLSAAGTHAVNMNGTFSEALLYFDPTIVLYSHEHILCAGVALVLFFLITICPVVLLCAYPTRFYEKLSRCCSPRKRIAVKIFVEALHSCFKDGLNGTKDYRMLAGIMFAPAAFCSAVEVPLKMLMPTYVNIVLIFVLLFLSFLSSYIRPCKSLVMNLSLSFHTLLFCTLILIRQLWYGDLSYNTQMLVATVVVLPTISHLLILLWVVYKVTRFCHRNHLKAAFLMFQRAALLLFRGRRHGYEELQDSLSHK